MNLSTKPSLLSLIFLLCNFFGHAQNSPLWHTLKPGAYKVGFTAEWEMDYSRTWGQSDLVRENYSSNRPYGRPVRISMWYPATSSGKPMKMKDYLYIKTSNPTAARAQDIITIKDIGDRSKSIKGLFTGNDTEVEKFLNTSTEAQMNANYVKGKKFPLLIYSLGQNDYTFENIILFEYLASKGFVVISVPHLGVNPRKDYLLVDEPLSFETQVRDMEFAMSQSLKLPFVDESRIGSFGMSFGTIYSLLFAARNSNIKALAGLDGTVLGGLEPFAYKYWGSPFYDSANIKAPMLQIFREGHKDMSVINSLIYSDRYLLEIKGLTHADFTSYPMYTLQTPKDLLDSFAYASRTPVFAEKMSEEICNYISIFFDAALNGKQVLLKSNKVFANGNDEGGISTRFINGIKSPNEEEFAKIILHDGPDTAITFYKKLLEEQSGTIWLRQRKLNRIGYEMIFNNKTNDAIKIFQFNVAVFPESADVYDSLGEGYMITGNKELALANYKRSLELNPKNEGAKKAIETLQSNK